MGYVNGEDVLGSLGFRLGVAGARITQLFANQVEALGLTHKQVGVLAVVDAGRARSQRDVAEVLGIAPSLVVTLVDRLVEVGAVTRTRDVADRRIQSLALTDDGRQLLKRCATIVQQLDADLERIIGLDAANISQGLTHVLDATILTPHTDTHTRPES